MRPNQALNVPISDPPCPLWQQIEPTLRLEGMPAYLSALQLLCQSVHTLTARVIALESSPPSAAPTMAAPSAAIES